MSRDVTRRALLGATAAAPVLAVAPAAKSDTMSVLPTGPLPTADAELVRQWRRFVRLLTMREAVHRKIKEAKARMPEWARWQPKAKGADVFPEWTDAMLAEHAIPAEMGRRPSGLDIANLNKKLMDEAKRQHAPVPEITDDMTVGAFRKIFSPQDWHPAVKAVEEENQRRMEAWERRRAEQKAEEQRVDIADLERQSEAIWRALDRVSGRIYDMPVHTPAGALVKMRVWAWWAEDDVTDPDHHTANLLTILRALDGGAFGDLSAVPQIPGGPVYA
jgi:hypothetical protein